ncbi:Uncharacterised protein [Mycobacterium tuberculosis]|nr:Uncharacterised protein [Mycobacterium tuberculosis]
MVPLRACPMQNVGAITRVRRNDGNRMGSSAKHSAWIAATAGTPTRKPK